MKKSQPEREGPWNLTSQDSELWAAIYSVIKSSNAAMPASAKRLELAKADMTILELLMRKPHSPSELASELQVTNAAISIALDRLEARGHVARTRDPKDGRRVLVTITKSAEREVGAELAPMFAELHAIVAKTPTKDRALVAQFLHQINHVLQSHTER
jgi:DNA-binding MarR family transcriptional regulator